MADPAALADATPSDWTTPGFLADTPPAPDSQSPLTLTDVAPAPDSQSPLTLTDVAPAMRATPKLRDEPKEEAFNPDTFLGSIKSSSLSSVAPEMKTGAPALQPVPEKDFDPDTFLASSAGMMHTTYDDKGNAVGTEPVNGALPTQNDNGFLARTAQSLDALNGASDPVKFLADAWTAPDKTTVAAPAPTKLGTTSSPTANLIESGNRSLYGSIGSIVQQAGNLLSRFDPRVDQTDDSTNPYITPGLAIRDFANRNFITDPNRPYSGGAGNLLGNVLPVTATLGLGGAAEAATIVPKVVGGSMFGGQMYAGAADQGVSTGKAQALGAAGFGLGALLPATRAFSSAPAIASATWPQLAKNVAGMALLNSAKTYWEMAGINWTSGELSQSVLRPDQQPTGQPFTSIPTQESLAYNALADAFPMVVAGLATHGIEQASAEMNVNRVAAAQGQSKADFLMNTTQAMDAIANDPAKSPEEKMQAVTGFLASFSPSAQKAITAHVQNIGATIDSIRAAADQAKALAPTNPLTATALQKEQVSTAVANMQATATSIDQEAGEAEKRAQEAFPEEKEPDKAPQSTLVRQTDPVTGKEFIAEDPELVAQRQATEAPQASAPEEQPVVQSPIPGGMTSDEYSALARHMENSPDPDVQARARELLQLRQQALQEHASTDSDARKTELEGEILAHEAALRKLSEEPQQEATPSIEPEATQAPQHVTGYDEYGNPIYAETPPAEEQPAKAQPAAEANPVAESVQPEQRGEPAAESTAGVAEQHPAEAAPAVEEKPPATPLDGLKRPALEKLALQEGHHPDDIKAAKTVNDVRDMIETKRAVGEKETPREDLKDDGKAQIDPKIKSLPTKYRKPVEAFIKAAKAGKMWGVTKFVLSSDPRMSNSAMWADPRRGTFDTVYINPLALHKIGADAAFNRKAFQEERLHNQAGYILNKRWEAAGKPGTFDEFYDKNFQAVHDQMTGTQRDKLQETYGVAGMHPVNIGEEFFRQTMQKAMGENLTEDEYNELAKRLRNNRPLRNIVQAVKERLTAMVQKLTSHGVKDDELTIAEKKLDELMSGGKKAEPPEGAKSEPTAPGLPSPKEEDDESKLWLSGDEGVRAAPVITPMKSPKQIAEYKPFVEEGETPGELKPTGAEQLRSQRGVPAEAQEREQTITNRIHSLEHVDIPADRQQEFRQRATDLARMHFSNEAARDLAESNAYVKVMIEAKKWQEQHGTLDGFGSRRIIQNSLLDDGRRVSRGQSIAVPAETPEPSTEGEKESQPKGYDASAQDYEEQQSQFEPVGHEGSELATTETPAKRAQDASVDRNMQDITNRISPYGRRLLEIWADTPHDPSAAFAPWVSRAAKEFGLPRAKIMADFDAINRGLRQEITQRGLTKDDFARTPGLPPMRREGFAEQGVNDERVSENLKAVLRSQTYQMDQNEADDAEAKTWVDAHDESAAFSHLMDAAKSGRPTPVDAFAAMILIRKWDAAPEEDGVAHLRSAELYTTMSSRATEAGKFTQPFRQWSKLGANGVLEAYKKIITPAIEGAKKPYKAITGQIENLIKTGKQQAIDTTIDRMDKNGVTGKVDKASAIALEEAKPIWQRYMEATSNALSKLRTEASSPRTQGALQEFADRLKTNLTGLMREMLPKAKGQAPEKMSATAKLGEVYKNMPEYQQAWDHARDFIKLKYADDPETLQQFEMAMNKAFEAPVKLTDKALDEQMKASGVSLRDVAKQWADSQNATRDSLIKAITEKMGLSPEQAKAAGDAIASRFQERLEAAKKNEVAKLLKQSGQNRLANNAPAITDKIFKALNLGTADNDVIWNAVAEKYGLPTYNKAIAQDLARRANEIQKMIAAGKEGKITDDKTQDMMNILANEAQKNMSHLRQIGEGEMAIFYGNIFGPSTIGRKSISEILNLVSEVGTMAAVQMRHGDLFALPRAYSAAMRGLYQRGGADFRSIMATGRGMRQLSGEYTADNLVERGKIFGNVPGLSKLNTPLSLLYKPVGRALYGAQAFFYSGAVEARANMIAYRAAKQLIREGKAPEEATVNRLTQEILGNSPEMRQGFAEQAREEGLTGRAAVLRAQELAEQSRPEEIRQAAHDFALRATFMQEPEGVLGVVYRGVAQITRTFPPLRLLVPVTRVVSNVFNNFLSYTPAGIGLPKFGGFDGSGAIKLAQEGKTDEMYQQIAKMTAGAMGTIGMVSLLGPNIQGAGPQDYQKRKQLMDEGWIPFSVKIGNNYYSYREWPTALMMAGVGSYMDQTKYGGGQKDALSRLALAFQASGRFALTSSWISSVNSLLDAFSSTNAESGWQSFLRTMGSTAGALVPFNQSTLKVIDKIFDPHLYPPNSVQGALMSQVAVARRFDNGNAPMLNALGDPVESNPIQAFYSSTNPDPVWNALAEKNIFIPTATKAERVNGRPITSEEFYTLTRDAGQATKQTLMSGGMDAIAGMDQEQAQHYLSAIYRRNIDTVKAEIAASAVDAGQGAAPAARSRRR